MSKPKKVPPLPPIFKGAQLAARYGPKVYKFLTGGKKAKAATVKLVPQAARARNATVKLVPQATQARNATVKLVPQATRATTDPRRGVVGTWRHNRRIAAELKNLSKRLPKPMLSRVLKGAALGTGGEMAINLDLPGGWEQLFTPGVAHAPGNQKAKSDKQFEKYIKSLSPKNAEGLLRSKILMGKKNK